MYPVAGEQTLHDLVREFKANGSRRDGLEIVIEDRRGAAAKFAAVVAPEAFAPVAVTTRLGREQVEQSVSITRIGRGRLGLEYLLREKRAGRLHRAEDVLVAANPGDVAGPTATLDMEAVVGLAESFNDLCQGIRAGALFEPVPDQFLHDRLDGGKIALGETHRLQVFEVLGDIDRRSLAVRRLGHYFEVLGRKLVHHHAAILAIGDLRDERRYGTCRSIRCATGPRAS